MMMMMRTRLGIEKRKENEISSRSSRSNAKRRQSEEKKKERKNKAADLGYWAIVFLFLSRMHYDGWLFCYSTTRVLVVVVLVEADGEREKRREEKERQRTTRNKPETAERGDDRGIGSIVAARKEDDELSVVIIVM